MSMLKRLAFGTALAIALATPAYAATPVNLSEFTRAHEPIILALKDALHATVMVTGIPYLNDDGTFPQGTGVGSGSLTRNPFNTADTSLWLRTNYHVAGDMAYVRITLCDGTDRLISLAGMPVYRDPLRDVVFVKIPTGTPGLENIKPIEVGRSADLRVGQPVYALGSPLGQACSVSQGIVSNTGRPGEDSPTVLQWPSGDVQTDASVNRGNSGGPLMTINAEGRLVQVGINTYILSPTGGSIGLGFSTPADMHQKVLMHVTQNGKSFRGLLGAAIKAVDNANYLANLGYPRDLVNRGVFGAEVTEVMANSAAVAAGARVGDIIVKVNDTFIRSPHHLTSTVGNTFPNQDATVTVFRKESASGRETWGMVTLTARLKDGFPREERREPGQYTGATGLTLGQVSVEEALRPYEDVATAELYQSWRDDIPATGAFMVTKVAQLSPAHQAGLGKGSLVIGAAKEGEALRRFATPAELTAYIDSAAGKPVFVEYLQLPPPEAVKEAVKGFQEQLKKPGADAKRLEKMLLAGLKARRTIDEMTPQTYAARHGTGASVGTSLP